MWYDRFVGLPPRGSPLESLFLLVFLQRQEAQLLATRAIVQSTLLTEGKQDPALEAFKAYSEAMVPFLEKAQLGQQKTEHELLNEFVKSPMKIDLKPIYQSQVDQAKRLASLRQKRLKPRVPGT